jgi:hypothetical protein
MRGLSEAAVRAMYSSETEEAIILLLTIYDPNDSETEVLHLADNFTQRLEQYTTDTDVVYGVSITGAANLGTVDVQSSDYNGTTANINSYFKINGVTVNYTFGRGHTVMVLNPATFAVESIITYDTYGLGNSQSLEAGLRAIATGKLVCIGSWDATALDQSTRDYINQQFYTTKTNTWGPTRITHTVIGVKGNRYVKPIEVVTANSSGFLSHFVLNSAYNNGTSISSTSPGYSTIWTSAELLVGNTAIARSTSSNYIDFLNQYGVWLKNTSAATFDRTVNVYFPKTANYIITGSCDNSGAVYIDGVLVLGISDFGNTFNASVSVTAGTHSVRLLGVNSGGPGSIGVTIEGTGLSKDFIFFPMEITLPSESDDGSSNCTIAINFVSKELIDIIRTNLTAPAKILLQLVLSSNPGYVEASFSNFYITGVTYSTQGVNLELSMINYSTEPFPAYNFSPKYFPGLF